MSKLHIWTKEEKEYLKQITPGHHYREIQELMNKKFNSDFTLEQIKGAINRYKLNTGFNGQFKKGNTPYNYMPVGSERVNGDGYVDVKVADPNKWKGKHILIWEKYNGPVPEGHAVIFGDGNRRNFDINNLIMVSRQQLLQLNRNNLIKNDANLTRTGVVIADLKIKINERKK